MSEVNQLSTKVSQAYMYMKMFIHIHRNPIAQPPSQPKIPSTQCKERRVGTMSCTLGQPQDSCSTPACKGTLRPWNPGSNALVQSTHHLLVHKHSLQTLRFICFRAQPRGQLQLHSLPQPPAEFISPAHFLDRKTRTKKFKSMHTFD